MLAAVGAFLYRWNFPKVSWDALTFEDASEARRDETDGLRLFATYNAARRRSEYPLGGPWYIDTDEIACGAFAGFLAFDAVEGNKTDTPDDFDDPTPPGLTIRYQVLAGGSPYWWSGAAWVAAGASDYNTLAEAQANFPHASLQALVLAAGGAFAVRVYLGTKDKDWTPTVSELSVLVDVGDANGIDDAVTRTLVDAISAIDVPGEWRDVADGALASINLALDEIRRKDPYRYSDVTAVYNLTDDPSRTTNLRTGYSTASATIDGVVHTTGTVTLSAPIGDGDTYELRFTHRPRATVTTHRDFAGVAGYELAEAPEWQIRDPSVDGEAGDRRLEVIASRADPGSGVNDSYTVWDGRRLSVDVTVAPRAELEAAGPGGSSVVEAMGQALRSWANRTRTLTSQAFGTPITVSVESIGTEAPDEAGLLQRFDHGLRLYSVPEPGTAVARKLVRTAQLTGGPGP